MDEGLSSEIIRATQTSLGKYVKRPPLSEKLLKKPPFRFLHDIITNVLKTTGFFEGLFDDNELISDNVKDRDSKILFLNKVINILSSTTGKTLSVKASKIVAGQEPEKTNKLLQCLAQALDENLSSKEAIRIYKENATSSQTKDQNQSITNTSKNSVKKLSTTKKLASKTNEKTINREKDSNSKDQNESKAKKELATLKNEPQNKKTTESKVISKKHQVENKLKSINKSHLTTKPATLNDANEQVESTQIINLTENIDELKNYEDVNTDVNYKPSNETNLIIKRQLSFTENELKTSQLSDEVLQIDNISTKDYVKVEHLITSENNENKNENLDEVEGVLHQKDDTLVEDNRKLVNHTKVEKSNYSTNSKVIEKNTISPVRNNVNTDRLDTVRPSSSRPGAPRLREKQENYLSEPDNILYAKVNIITEHSQNEEEEDSSIIIVEQDNFTSIDGVKNRLDTISSEDEHGHLVQQILNSQKELNQSTGKTEIEWQFGAQKYKQAQNQEIDTLKYNIQAFSRIANPLGKLLDHIQEDVEVMRQELQQWTNIYEDVSKEMHAQKILTEGALLPLHSKLKQIQNEIQEKHRKINEFKILIHKNSLKIEKLLVINM